MANRRRKKRTIIPRGYIYIAIALLAIVIIVAGVYGIKKYAPTKEHMDLSEYFEKGFDNQTALILDNEYYEVTEEMAYPLALHMNDQVYLELGFVKENMDDGYVYDNSEVTLRYATDTQVFTALMGSGDYTVDKSNESLPYPIVIAQNDRVYVAADYMKLLTDFQYKYYSEPDRVFVEQAGLNKGMATVKKKGQIRKLNGPKSPILEDVTKGEEITVVRDTGKWSFVVSENGVMGYLRNNRISDIKETAVEKTLAERNYNHISFGKKINMAWHQVTSRDANSNIASVVADSGNINVISPTWFYLNNNSGGIASLASGDYVNYCHSNDIQVWGLVSNLEDASVDTSAVLNSTSARDTLVNNLIAQAITYGLDGINVDIEQLAGEASDGYIQFIKELSIKCEKNDIILSVDNYVPTASSQCYNRAEQAKYVDYVIVMAYDEYYGGSEVAGSVASLDWVSQGITDTLLEVPSDQVVLGMPFYCRVWKLEGDTVVSSEAYGMGKIQTFLKSNEISTTWDKVEGQYYGEAVSGDYTYKVWVEDEASLEEKLKLIGANNLAGGAFWKLGFDNDGTWNVISKYL
ncbi:MAG: glycosyl hydrolase family 18 [Pseudobutyrivibrio sp.]|nr:glycosyl hydrolase family 18 [Pseudobutyrivibrio sp.]